MSTIKLLCSDLRLNFNLLTKEEILFIEAELFTYIYEELNRLYKLQYQDYFHAVKINANLEDTFMETNFIRCLIKDILITEEYSLQGLAYYTHTPEDVIVDVAMGINTDPALSIARKIIEIHRSVRPDLYAGIMKKFIDKKLQ